VEPFTLEVFEAIISLLVVGAAIAALAGRIGAPYPALVALAGAALALVPGLPAIELDPELALALFIAPVLMDTAFDASPRDLRANWVPVSSLALGAVMLTVALVAFVARAFVPDLPWAAAIALGAIVAPPDAAAASTVLRRLKPPHKILVILEGESLFNDASALLIFRLAIAATVGGAISGWNILSTMLFVTVGSLVLGFVSAKVTVAISKQMTDVPIAVVVQFGSTFAIWLLAERLHLSGIITVVVFAIMAAREVPEFLTARMRIPAWSVWDVAVFVLNILAFVLVGFQLKSIIGRTSQAVGLQYLIIASIICVTVILARIIWVSLAFAIRRRLHDLPEEKKATTHDIGRISSGGAAIVAWSGMRGTVTLAAALALPIGFPHRDLAIASAFGVTLGTLVIQGLTLRPLLRWLNIKDDGSVEQEMRLARTKALQAALHVFTDMPPPSTEFSIKENFQLQLSYAQKEFLDHKSVNSSDSADQRAAFERERKLLTAAFQAQRHELVSLRANDKIGDTAFQKIEEELDWMELGWMHLFRQEDK
jgi:Na+/H+ antiporter